MTKIKEDSPRMNAGKRGCLCGAGFSCVLPAASCRLNLSRQVAISPMLRLRITKQGTSTRARLAGLGPLIW